MRGKVVVITGATSGIGQMAAEKLAGMGARMVLVARDEARVRRHGPDCARLAPAWPIAFIMPTSRGLPR
jgi:NADP-dependent 3-hydroxy acid dehydrogenase YdfG